MKTWKSMLLLGIVLAGIGTIYLMSTQTKKPTRTSAPEIASTVQDPKPAGYDPDLILPPPDIQGYVIDLPSKDVRDHFEAMAGLKLPKDVEQGLLTIPPPDDLIPVGARIVRAPAPNEELIIPIDELLSMPNELSPASGELLPMPRDLP